MHYRTGRSKHICRAGHVEFPRKTYVIKHRTKISAHCASKACCLLGTFQCLFNSGTRIKNTPSLIKRNQSLFLAGGNAADDNFCISVDVIKRRIVGFKTTRPLKVLRLWDI